MTCFLKIPSSDLCLIEHIEANYTIITKFQFCKWQKKVNKIPSSIFKVIKSTDITYFLPINSPILVIVISNHVEDSLTFYYETFVRFANMTNYFYLPIDVSFRRRLLVHSTKKWWLKIPYPRWAFLLMVSQFWKKMFSTEREKLDREHVMEIANIEVHGNSSVV